MAVPPNLPTTHQDNISEIITAATINDLATAANVVGRQSANLTATGVAATDTANIQAAINSPGKVSVAPGRYLINAPLILSDHVQLLGPLAERGEWWGVAGKGAVFVNNGNFDTIQTSPTGPNLALASTIEGISFESTSGTGAHVNIQNGMDNFAVRRCSFQGKTNAIIMNGTVYIIEIEGNFCNGQSGAAFQIANSTGTGGHTLIFEKNWLRAGANYGIYFSGTTTTANVVFRGNIFDTFSGTSSHNIFSPSASILRATFQDNWFEGTSGAGSYAVNLSQGGGYTFAGNHVANVANGFRLPLVTGCVLLPGRFSSVSGNSIALFNDGSAGVVIFPQTDSSVLGISDPGTIATRFASNGGMTLPGILKFNGAYIDMSAQTIAGFIGGSAVTRFFDTTGVTGNVQIADAGGLVVMRAMATNVGLQLNSAGYLYSGAGVPSNAIGNNGDFYFRTDGGAGTAIYQRRVGAWVATAA